MFDYIKNRDGKRIFAVIDYPSGKGPFGAVLIIHGFTGFSSERHLNEISRDLVDKGFLTLRPDLTKNPGRSYLEFSNVTYNQELKDCEDSLEFLLNMEEVDINRVGIAGHSLGGMIAAEVASKRKEIRALATLSAVYSAKFQINRIFGKTYEKALKDFKSKGFTTRWSDHMGKRLKIKKSFADDFVGRTVDDFAKNIKCPTLVISSGKDEAVIQEQADSYLKNIGAREKSMEIIEGSDHVYTGEALNKVAPIVANWFAKKLI